MRTSVAVAIGMLLLGGCYHPPRGGVSPAPPGPVDTLNILFRNDYSRLCPERYDYCRAGKNSICCPSGGCCRDATGPYCCDGGYARDDRDDRYGHYDERSADQPGDRGPCGPRSTTCSRSGIVVCCAEHEGCCADARGLYCCAARDDDRY
jgi:hypothetical protein